MIAHPAKTSVAAHSCSTSMHMFSTQEKLRYAPLLPTASSTWNTTRHVPLLNDMLQRSYLGKLNAELALTSYLRDLLHLMRCSAIHAVIMQPHQLYLGAASPSKRRMRSMCVSVCACVGAHDASSLDCIDTKPELIQGLPEGLRGNRPQGLLEFGLAWGPAPPGIYMDSSRCIRPDLRTADKIWPPTTPRDPLRRACARLFERRARQLANPLGDPRRSLNFLPQSVSQATRPRLVPSGSAATRYTISPPTLPMSAGHRNADPCKIDRSLLGLKEPTKPPEQGQTT